MKVTTLNDFLKYRVLPEQKPIVALLRSMMRQYAPGAEKK